MGLSTDTPGLKGEDRSKTLQHRLQVARDKANGDIARSQTNSSQKPIGPPQPEKPVIIPIEAENLGQLGVVDARKRLAALGVDSSTPGLAGENRRVALIARLLEARGMRRASNCSPEPEAPTLLEEHKERYGDSLENDPGLKSPAVGGIRNLTVNTKHYFLLSVRFV